VSLKSTLRVRLGQQDAHYGGNLVDGARILALFGDVATEILRLKRVSDPTYRRAVAKFGEQGVIDLLGVVGYYNFLAIVMNATRTGLPEGAAEPLKRYPE